MSKVFQVLHRVWKLVLLVLLLLLSFAYAMFQGGFVSWFLFYSFLPFALYALCLAFYPLEAFTVERNFAKREFYANDPITVKVTLKRKFSFPLLLLMVEDCLSTELTEAMAKKENKTFLYPGFRKSCSFVYRIEKLPRGEHSFSGIRLIASDVLGFVQKEVQLEHNEKLLVYPAYGPWFYRSSAKQNFEQGTVSVTSQKQQDTTMAVGIREYRPGDKLSWINWKVSAKRDEMMMKEFEQRSSQDLFLVLDCSPQPLFELLVQFTASVAHATLQKGAKIGFFSVSDERMVLPLQGGEKGQKQLLYHLAKIRDRCPISLEQVLRTERFLFGQNVSLLVITAQITPELMEAAQMYMIRRCPVTVIVIRHAEESITAYEKSMKEMAYLKGVDVQFVSGFFLSSERKEA